MTGLIFVAFPGQLPEFYSANQLSSEHSNGRPTLMLRVEPARVRRVWSKRIFFQNNVHP